MDPHSPRLAWRRLGADDLTAFHRLLIEPHVRRFLLDGHEVGLDWCAEAIRASDALFDARGLGLWLLRRPGRDEVIGFAGFKVFPSMGSAPQLLYGVVEAATGKGLATEAAAALLPVAASAGLDPVTAAVDGPNHASLRVLEKLGFERTRTTDEGDFGSTVYFARRPRVSLETVTEALRLALIDLAVAETQRHFVADNAKSLRQAGESDRAWPRAICADGVPVGFVMVALDPVCPFLWRLMIDARYQGKGYGRLAMEQVIAFARSQPGAERIETSYVRDEGDPSGFYRRLGFAETGQVEEGEHIMRLMFEG